MESKKKLWRGLSIFMAVMLIMTFVSRMVYVSRMPQIKWSRPAAASIRNELTVDGTVEAVNAQAITGLEGLLVEKVHVTPGDRITEGDLLYEVNMEDLQMQLARLEAEERVWQGQVQAQRQEAATEITRAQEDYDITMAELDRQIEEQTKQLENVMEDLDTHMFRIPEEDASDEIWIAWADERVRLDRDIAERKRAIEDANFQKEKLLKQADRSIEDARQAQSEVTNAYGAGFSAIGQIQEREEKIEVWKELVEKEGKVTAGQEGTILEIMLQSGMRMGSEAVIRYADAGNGLVFRTVITQDQKALVHTGDSVKVSFPGSSEEVSETIDSIVQESGGYRVTIRLEPGVGQGRTEAVMEAVSTSEIYDYVIPLQALHNESGNCIYVLEEKNGILGTELNVRSLTVRLLEQNEDYAAIADELLSVDTKIVTESDRELSNGIAVKEWGE